VAEPETTLGRTSHLDADRLVLIALGEQQPTGAERSHLDTCPDCQDQLASLTEVASIGRQTRDTGDLPMPPTRVWDQIAAATLGTAPTPTPAPTPAPASAGSTPAGRGPAPAPAGRIAPRVPSSWARTAVVALAAAVLGIVGTVGVSHVVQRLNEPTVAAQTTLTAYGDTPAAAHGSAELLDRNGQSALQIHVADLPPAPGYYEVWLINPNDLQMISVGVLGGQSDVVLPLPSTVDINRFRLVDVSAELYDGNSAHSGHSLLRGTL
jgi:hypothetical protein